ncbi:MAG: hypothetical protein J7513_10360 [Solirubrobacteraceae bacterium]|nr:hypothetical protein [Solirubrobacteraceae bacterium]
MAYRYGAQGDAERAARRRRRWEIAFAVGAVTLPLLLAVLTVVRGRDMHWHARWQLAEVSADARTLTLAREANLCSSKPEQPVVREAPTTVHIALPTVRHTGFLDGSDDCAAVSGTAYVRVRLGQPLGRRTLTQPSGGTLAGTAGLSVRLSPGGVGCARLIRIPQRAPALEVPWVQERLRACRR